MKKWKQWVKDEDKCVYKEVVRIMNSLLLYKYIIHLITKVKHDTNKEYELLNCQQDGIQSSLVYLLEFNDAAFVTV